MYPTTLLLYKSYLVSGFTSLNSGAIGAIVLDEPVSAYSSGPAAGSNVVVYANCRAEMVILLRLSTLSSRKSCLHDCACMNESRVLFYPLIDAKRKIQLTKSSISFISKFVQHLTMASLLLSMRIYSMTTVLCLSPYYRSGQDSLARSSAPN